MRRRTYLAVAAGAAGLAGCAGGAPDEAGTDGPATDGESGGERFAVETVVDGLERPWGIAVLGDGRLLVTERPGRLRLVDPAAGDARTVAGTPEVYAAGQGGLLDVAVRGGSEPESEPEVYLTYAATDDAGRSATHLGRGRLDAAAGRLTGFERLHVAEPFVDSDAHYGSRVVVGPDDRLYVTAGDRQFKDFGPGHVARDRSNELGTVLRLAPDGSAPEDNPFVDEPGVRDSIFTYGHRNPQGLAVHPETGALWEHEHGEEDGDEVNVLEAGGDYGWPVASEACNYGTDDPVGVSHADREGVTAPVHVWECGTGGFPPSGATIYDGDAFPSWRGDLLAGNLAGQYLGRLSVDGRAVAERAPLLADRGWRVRAVADDPAGRLYVAVDAESAPLVRLSPA